MSAAARPTVSFIIPVRNDAARLERCLTSIRLNTLGGARIEMLVIDHGSSDASPEVARRAGARVITVTRGSVSELRNIGAAHASGDVLAFVDADHEISAGWAAAALQILRDDSVGAAGALCHSPIEGTWVQRAYGRLRGVPRGRHDVEWLGSGNMAVRRDAFDAAGGFDTMLTTCEDVDLCNRLRALGYRIVSDAGMRSVHYGDPGTLRDLFKGELWRGGDNLRVSLRGGLTWRGLPSVVIPVVDLAAILAAALALLALAAGWTAGLLVVAAAAAIVAAGAGLRVLRSALREGAARPIQWLQAWVVSCVYDLGRALALVARVPHRNVRPQETAAR